jgi:hypothetical protein
LSGTPPAGSAGDYPVTIEVNDGNDTSTQSFTIVVSAADTNTAPNITSTANTTATEGEAYSYGIVVRDPDGDTLTITAPTKPVWLTLTNTSNGLATLSGTPPAGSAGDYPVTIEVNDGNDTSTQSFTIVVSASDTNTAPNITSRANTTATEGEAYSYGIVVRDPDGDTLTITAPTKPDWLSLTNTSNGQATLSGTPGADDVGDHPVTLEVSDGNDTATQSFTIVVGPVTEEATSLEGSVGSCWSTPQEKTLEATLVSEEFSSLSTYRIIENPKKGTLTLIDATTGAFEYIPHRNGSRGLDSFTYQVDDPRNDSVVKVANIIIDQKLMSLGDGIAEGVEDAVNEEPLLVQQQGYRKPLYEALIQAGYSIDFVGTQSTGTRAVGFDTDHESHPGWTVDQIAYGLDSQGGDGIYAWLERNPSDIVLLHGGTYGLNANPMGVESILNEIERWENSSNGNPVKVILALIIDQTPLNADVKAFNKNLQILVLDRVLNPDNAAYPDKIFMVDQHSALVYPEDLFDALHPNGAGYAKMAQRWFEVLTKPESEILVKCP